jgi:uncharacterized protein YjdB
VFIGCNGGSTGNGNVPVAGVSLNMMTSVIAVGGAETLTPAVWPDNATIAIFAFIA